MRRFVFATFNPGKVREVASILAGLPIDLVGPREVGVDRLPPEDGRDFVDNAVIKAVCVWGSAGGLPVLADDSGLEVAALDGAPGVHSARFAGDAQDDAANISKLLDVLRGVPDRRARFVCHAACLLGPEWPVEALRDGPPGVAVLGDHPRTPDGSRLLVATGEVAGRIIDVPAGDDGFGYDPIFFLDDLGCTFAQLERDHKNALSHRGRAFRLLRAAIERMMHR
jgi:XTP/dITP diphosphohydrolase